MGMEVLVLKTKGCHKCHEVISQIEELAKELPIEVKVIDVVKEPSYLEKYPIMSSPGVVFDGELLYEGFVDIEGLKRRIKEKMKE